MAEAPIPDDLTREKYTNLARDAARKKRYDIMIKIVDKIVALANLFDSELTFEEREVFVQAYKSFINSKTTAFRDQIFEDHHGVFDIEDNFTKVEKEISQASAKVSKIVDELVPNAFSIDSKVFYMTFKEDCQRKVEDFKSSYRINVGAEVAKSSTLKLFTEFTKAWLKKRKES